MLLVVLVAIVIAGIYALTRVQPTGQAATITTCIDTDNNDPYVKGTLTMTAGDSVVASATDVCEGDRMVVEHYCVVSTAVFRTVVCPNGCQDGACVR